MSPIGVVLLPQLPTNRLRGKLSIGSRILASTVLLLLSLTLQGCGGKPSSESASRRASSQSAQGRVDHLSLAMDFVFSDDRFQPEAFNASVASALNQWIEKSDIEIEWTPDAMLETLSEEVRAGVEVSNLDGMGFGNRDAEFLQEIRWCSALAERMDQSDRFADFRWLFGERLKSLSDDEKEAFAKSNDRLAYLIAKQHPELSDVDAKQLATSLRIFDWIVRNVQLDDPLPKLQSEAEIRQFALTSSGTTPASMGAPGPGYTLFAWQALKFGHGDWLQRSRIFLLCCRQLDIDAVMLAVPDVDSRNASTEVADTEPVERRAWLPAVRIGERLFLFDMELGMPIPASEQGGIATLQNAIDQPAVLNALAIDTNDGADEPVAYQVDSEQAAQAVAWLEADPITLSKRMAALENSLTADQRLLLQFDASAQADRIKQCPTIDQVQLWSLPFDTMAYRNVYERAVQLQMTRVVQSFIQNEMVYDIDIELIIGRHRTILGMLENDEETSELGAKAIFFNRRFPDEVIDLLRENRDMQVAYGIDVLDELTADQKQAQIEQLQTQLIVVRTNASYWLAIAHLESDNPATAINWLQRVGEYDPRGIWKAGTEYNLARAFESVGRFDEAVESFRASSSSQAHGNRLRARYLERYSN